MGSSSLLEGTRSGSECEDTGTHSGLGSGTLFSLRQMAPRKVGGMAVPSRSTDVTTFRNFQTSISAGTTL